MGAAADSWAGLGDVVEAVLCSCTTVDLSAPASICRSVGAEGVDEGADEGVDEVAPVVFPKTTSEHEQNASGLSERCQIAYSSWRPERCGRAPENM
ncbi:hypothetical protein OK074_6154 [Actinobacteria bacterium OK074]|nr:hypothetical protein OK074_6154 [Actinobacteria bacterium OK074]